MKKTYTQQDVSQFLSKFKELSTSYQLEKVHQLINNPDAKAKHKVNFKYKPFKFIIMTSFFLVGLFSILFWLTPNENIEKSKLQVLESKGLVNHAIEIDSNKNELVNTKVDNVKMPEKGIEIVNNPIKSIEIENDSSKIAPLSQENTSLNPKTEIVLNQEIEDSIIENIQFIELNTNQYSKLGFEINSDRIQIRTKGWNVFLTKKSRGVESIRIFKWKEQKSELIFLTNRSGVQMIKWSIIGDDKDKFEEEYFKSKIQNLVPVVMLQSNFPEILTEDQVFWFEPTEALFNSLPESISKQLKKEYNYVIAETEEQRKVLATTCTYFESCKSTLKVENCKMYPNPAITSATLEFTLPETVIGTISLSNISGAQLKILVPTTSFPKGNNTFKFDLTDLSPGIYLVLIKTDKGFKTQRLIISR